MHRTGIHLLFLTGAFGIAACVPPETRVEAMQAEVAARLAAAGPAQAARPVFAGDPRAALRGAVESSGEFRAAVAAEDEALAGIGIAASATKPQVTGSGMAGQISEGSPSDDVITGAAVDLMLTQLVYDGGASRAGLDQATAAALAARAAAVETGNRVALDAYRAWVNLWLAQQQMSLLQARTGEFATIVDQLDRMTETGMIDSSMREGAHVAQIDIEMERARLQGELLAAEATFLRFFASVPAGLPRPAALMDARDLQLAASAWQNAPSLRRAAAELLAGEAATAGARAALKPVVSLSTGVTSPMDPDDTTDTSVGFQVRYTFGDGGKRKSQIAAAEAREEALGAALSEAQAQARALIVSSLAGLKALDRSAALTAEKMAASATKAETARAQIGLGQSTLSALMDAEIANYRATEQDLRITAERLILQAEIAAGTGQLLSRLGLAEAAPSTGEKGQ